MQVKNNIEQIYTIKLIPEAIVSSRLIESFKCYLSAFLR